MICLDDSDPPLSFYSTTSQQGVKKLYFPSFTSGFLSFPVSSFILLLPLILDVFFLYSPPPSPSLSSTSPTHLIFYCLSSRFSAAILLTVCPPVNPSVISPPLLPLLCAPDLLSLCLITKSTGSSRRSCRRFSPSVRSSLTRVRGTSWHGEVCVCMCISVCIGK